MANRKQTKRRRKARQRAARTDQATLAEGSGPADTDGPGSVDATEPSSPDKASTRPKSRLSAAMDRMEQTADERPPAPWGNFPLGPLSVLAGLVLIVIGAINTNPVQLMIGMGLGALGGLEVSMREHFAGFRSHTTLLAGFVYVVAVGVTFYAAKWVLWQCLIFGFVLAAPSFWWLRRKFEKASGGLTYKLR